MCFGLRSKNPPPPRMTGELEDSIRRRVDTIDDFFSEVDTPHPFSMKTATLVFIFSLILVVAWAVLFVREHFVKNGDLYGWTDKEIMDALNLLVAAGIALSASFIAIYWVNRANYRRIDAVKQLTHEGALKTVLQVLRDYRNRTAVNKIIVLTLWKFESKDGINIVHCKLDVSASMVITSDNLVFEFIKLRRKPGGAQTTTGDLVEKNLGDIDVPADLYSVDVTDMSAVFCQGNESEIFKGLTGLMINTDTMMIKSEPDARDPDHLRYNFDVKELRKKDSFVQIRYRYEFALECPGHTFSTVAEPTMGFSCTVDFSAVRDQVSVYPLEMLNSRLYRHDVTPHPDGRITISASDWVVPQSSVVFVWYPKTKSQSWPPPAARPVLPDALHGQPAPGTPASFT
jgi:hypothetical protein